MKRVGPIAAWLTVVAVGAAFRLTRLDNRPMHCDEAVHAIKFGRLLEHNDYIYNPREYHGPSLNYFTFPVAWIGGAGSLTEISEVHLRLVPAVFGIALVGLVALLRADLGYPATLAAAFFTAVSPAMVFYSRYYIQEMLLVFFTFGAMVSLWRHVREAAAATSEQGRPDGMSRLRSAVWLILLGLCLAMMHATKETCMIAVLVMAIAAGITMTELRRWKARRLVYSGAVVVLVASSVSALFFSSFLANPHGVLDSYTTYFHYLGRASGEGTVGRHVYPWHYYFHVLLWSPGSSGRVWTEGSIAVLALVGLAAVILGRGLAGTSLPLVRFISVYTVLLALVYSILPYKTPWCALGFFHGMILLAGVGAVVLIRGAPGRTLRALLITLLVAASVHLMWQAWQSSFVAFDDPQNPYVYAHTTRDIPQLAERVKEITALHPDGLGVHVQVICPEDDYWPLPWYLRQFRRVGWFHCVPEGPPGVILITQPEMEAALTDYLYVRQPPGQLNLYVPVSFEPAARDWQLRPHVLLRVYARFDLWQAYQAARESPRQ